MFPFIIAKKFRQEINVIFVDLHNSTLVLLIIEHLPLKLTKITYQ